MSAPAFIESLRDLHDKAKKGTLTTAERPEYEKVRGELGRLLLAAQSIAHGGKTLRNALRIAKVLKVGIDFGGGTPDRTSTIDLAASGFAVLLPSGHPIGKPARFTIYLPNYSGGGTQPVNGTASVASSRPQGGWFRVSFKFEKLSPSGIEHLEIVIIDAVLAKFNAT